MAESNPDLEAFRAETGRTYRLLSDDMDEREIRLGNPELIRGLSDVLGIQRMVEWRASSASQFGSSRRLGASLARMAFLKPAG